MRRAAFLVSCLLAMPCVAQDAAPTVGMEVWLRAEDIPGRVTVFARWKSPPAIDMSVGATNGTGEHAWRVGEQIAGLPAARLAERSSLLFNTPAQYESFTLFAVARQAPGAQRGALVSSSRDEAQGIGWSEGKAVTLRAGPGKSQTLDFPEAAQFHVLTVRSERGAAFVFGNGKPLNESPVTLGERFAVQFVGNPPQGVSVNSFEALRALRMPANPTEGSDIAELIIWPRALNDAEMRATLGYLRGKYALDFPPSAPGVLVAAGAGASATPASTAASPPVAGPVLPGGSGDPHANYPPLVGRQFQKTSTCNVRDTKPHEPGYCLHPTLGSVAWHRADDEFSFHKRLRSWDGALFSELAQPEESRQPELVNAQVGRYPAIRFENERHFDFRKPMELTRFSIFVVGRRTPSAGAGPIFGMGGGGSVYMYWSQREGLLLGEWEADPVAAFSVPDQDKFHLLALHGDGLVIRAFVNSRESGTQPMPAGPGTFRIGQVGAGLRYWETLEHAIGSLSGGSFSLKGSGAKISSEIAEILIYDTLLEPAEQAKTERYLRRKYGLP